MPKMNRSRVGVLCEQLLYLDLSWSDLEDIFLGYRQRTPRQYKSVNGLFNIEELQEDAFRRMFTFEKEHLKDLKTYLLMPDTVISSQGVCVSGEEALLISLRRLACPNRWRDLEPLFGRHCSTLSSIVSTVLRHIEDNFGHLLDLTNNKWLNLAELGRFSQAMHRRGAPLKNCWGFVDATARPICRPSVNQRSHKRVHAVKYQSVMCANGIVCDLDGPYSGHRHDAGILGDSGLYSRLEHLVQGSSYTLYGDPLYPLRPLLMRPYAGSSQTETQQRFNSGMSTVRQAVEWGFGKTVELFAFLDFEKNQKILLQNVSQMYKVGTILTNCHTCLYGSQVSMFFGLKPPSLQEYLVPVTA
ncbi:uncharacterized protein LOC119433401 [Dermacentor silvarum]|uniref:uncharacterized protein LOC119433401 n=1 Tax=Dermacentor silvarum TaxID=543639 RepID=UPI0021017838|nr:uncharacterized protein LOC119433401 [Dermacentor silvarum]